MTVTRELSITYNSFTVGGSTARQITDYPVVESAYETGVFEFSFITSASTAAAFQTEVAAVEAAFRTPRADLTVTYGSGNTVSWKQSNNTGFDANPVITKRGDIGDSGRSRRYWVRIEFGMPADNVNTSFRRYSTVSINYSPSRVRTVTINGVYTANSTDGTTGSYAQYRAQILTYGQTVTSGLDSNATWEVIGEPDISRNETDKVTQFTIVYKEIIQDQSAAGLDDQDIVDPVMVISVQRVRPGDSSSGQIVASGGGSESTGWALVDPNGTIAAPIGIPTPTDTAGHAIRPAIITISYQCAINKERTTNLSAKWNSTIRSFLIFTAGDISGYSVTLVDEKVSYDQYENRISAEMQFLGYTGSVYSQTITVSDSIEYGINLVPVWTRDEYDYYEYKGPAKRFRTCEEESERSASSADPNKMLDGSLVFKKGGKAKNIASPDNWVLISRVPSVAVKEVGFGRKLIATVKVTTVLQYRNKKTPSKANAGGVTGGNVAT